MLGKICVAHSVVHSSTLLLCCALSDEVIPPASPRRYRKYRRSSSHMSPQRDMWLTLPFGSVWFCLCPPHPSLWFWVACVWSDADRGRSVTLVGPSARCQQRQNLAFTQRSARSLHPSRKKERNIFSLFFSLFFSLSLFLSLSLFVSLSLSLSLFLSLCDAERSVARGC